MPDLEIRALKEQLKGLGLFIVGKKGTLWDGQKKEIRGFYQSSGGGCSVDLKKKKPTKKQLQFAPSGI